MTPRDRLIVGLDVPTVAEAESLIATLGSDVSFYKIGYQLAFAGGLEFARELAQSGKKIFLDMKLLDIDNTVASGVENIVKMGMSMLTLHACPKAMRAAVEAEHTTPLGAAFGLRLCLDEMIDGGFGVDECMRLMEAFTAAVLGGIGSLPGAVLGGLLPGYFDSVTVFIVFAGCALFSALVLIPHWNSRPAGQGTDHAYVPNRAMTIKPIGPLIRIDSPIPIQNSSLCGRIGRSPAFVAI